MVDNPAHPDNPAGETYSATAEQYEAAIAAAVDGFEETRQLPAYERGAILRNDQRRASRRAARSSAGCWRGRPASRSATRSSRSTGRR